MQPYLGFGTVGVDMQLPSVYLSKMDGYVRRDTISSHCLDLEAPVLEVKWHCHVSSYC